MDQRILNKIDKWFKTRYYSEFEIRQKLSQNKVDSAEIDTMIEYLKSVDWINDERFAELWIENRFETKGYGKIRLIFELKQKGIAQEIIEKYLNNQNEEKFIKRPLELLQNNFKYKKNQNENKMIQYLLRKGYSYPESRDATQEYLKNNLVNE